MEFNRCIKMKKNLHDGTIALNPKTFLVIRILDAFVLRILSQFLSLAMVLVVLSFLGTVLKGFSSSSHNNSFVPSGSLNEGLLNLILHDFSSEVSNYASNEIVSKEEYL
ncbi:hypothetical protein E2542_SST26371 [Spatholobus suberectus]|nr:hypothetical protein E2542_SST26371 [Spatholobus suberectus]